MQREAAARRPGADRRALLAGTALIVQAAAVLSANAAEPFKVYASEANPPASAHFQMLSTDVGTASSQTVFDGTQSAGSGSLSTSDGTSILFKDHATASSATIVNNGGSTGFTDDATAASADLTANEGGSLTFDKRATAADSRIVTNSGGSLSLEGNATAASAFITDNGAATFAGASTADNAEITVNGGGALAFGDTSTAGIARIANSGVISVSGQATLAGALVTNNATGTLALSGTSSAGSTSSIANSGVMTFADGSTLGAAALVNNATGQVGFAGTSSAGSGFVANSGIVVFGGKSTAGGAELIGNAGSRLTFADQSSAGSSTITSAALLRFTDQSTAGSADITMGPGAAIAFADMSDGGDARLHLDQGASLDIAAAAGGIRLGSLSGAGAVSLGGNTLFVGDDEPLISFAGTIGDAGLGGGLVKRGGGTLNLSGQSTYSGPTVIADGTLQAGAANALSPLSSVSVSPGGILDLAGFDEAIGALAGSGAVNLEGGTLTAGGTGASTAYSGAISGLGGLTKTGPGTLSLTGDSTYSGETRIEAGTLAVAGSIAASPIVVNPDGALTGNGTVGPVSVAGGELLVQADQSLAINGNLGFSPGARLLLGLSGRSAGALAVNGAAALDGDLVLLPTGPVTIGNYAILTATDAVTGTFTLNEDMPFLGFALAYAPHGVRLDITRDATPFAAVANTANQRATATAVEGLGAGTAVYDAVLATPSETGARYAFDALSGEGHASVETGLLDDGGFVREAVLDHLRAAYGDSLGGVRIPARALAAATTASVPATAVEPAGYSAWASGYGAWGRNAGDGNASALGRTTGGLVAGVDLPFALLPTGDWRLGIMGGYGHSDFDVDARKFTAAVDSWELGAYAGAQIGPLGLRLGAFHGWHHVETDRSVALPGFSDDLSAAYDAETTQAFGEAGYRFGDRTTTLEPFAGLAYVRLRTDGFGEDGGAAALRSSGATAETTFSTLGMHFAHRFSLGGMAASAGGTLGWRHAFGDTQPVARLAFAGSGTFAVQGAPIAEDAALIEAGFGLALPANLRLGLSYQGQFAGTATTNAARLDLSGTF